METREGQFFHKAITAALQSSVSPTDGHPEAKIHASVCCHTNSAAADDRDEKSDCATYQPTRSTDLPVYNDRKYVWGPKAIPAFPRIDFLLQRTAMVLSRLLVSPFRGSLSTTLLRGPQLEIPDLIPFSLEFSGIPSWRSTTIFALQAVIASHQVEL